MDMPVIPRVETGWLDVPNAIYHNDTRYRYTMTNSGLKELERSPAHWLAWRTSEPQVPKRADNALHFGKAFHSWMLGEAHKVLPVEKPDLSKADTQDIIEVWPKQFNALAQMELALHECEIASLIVNHPHAIYEKAGFFKDPQFDIVGSIKPDIRIPSLGIIADLKTTVNAGILGFSRSVRTYKYHWQAFHYLRGANVIDEGENTYDSFLIIAIEKEPPYGCMVYNLSEVLFEAEFQVLPLYERFETCLKANNFPCYDNSEIITL